MSQYRSLSKKAASFFLLGNLAAYILFHLSYAQMLEDGGIYLEYARMYLADAAWGFVMPVTAAALALFVFARSGRKAAAVFLTIPALCRLIYSLPYYYIYFVSLGFDSLESLPLMVICAVLESLICYAFISFLLFIGVLFSGSRAKDERREAIHSSLDKVGEGHSPASRALLAITLGELILALSIKLYDIIVFLLEYGLDLLVGELLLMMLDLIIPILLFIGSVVVLSLLLRRMKREYDEVGSE
jgi:hypothetical protein